MTETDIGQIITRGSRTLFLSRIPAAGAKNMFDNFKAKREEAKAKKDAPDPVEPEFAEKLMSEAEAKQDADEPKKAEKLFNRAYDIYNQLYAADPEKYREQTAKCCESLGGVYEDLEKYENAYEFYQMAVELIKEPAKFGNTDMKEMLAEEYCNIGDTFFFRSRYDDALEYYMKALNIYSDLVKSDKGKYREDIAYCYDCIAKANSGNEEYSKAIENYEKVVYIYTNMIKEHKGSQLDEEVIDYNEELAVAYGDIGYVYSCCKAYDDAEDYYLKAADIFRRLARTDPERYMDSLASQYEDLAALYEDMGRTEKVKEYDRKAQNPDV